MKKCVLFAIAAILITACQRTNTTPAADVEDESDSLPVYDMFAQPLFDTLTCDNLIESVRFVPLESTKEALISDFKLYAHKFGDRFVLTSGEHERLSIKVYSESGSYIGNGFSFGRGPLELPMPWSFKVDEIAKEIVLNGMTKVLVFNPNTMKTRVYRTDLSADENKPIFYLYPFANGKYLGHGTASTEEEMENFAVQVQFRGNICFF